MFTTTVVLQVVLRSIGMPPTLMLDAGSAAPAVQPGHESDMPVTLATPETTLIPTLARTVWSVAPAALLALPGLPSSVLLTRFWNLPVTSASHWPTVSTQEQVLLHLPLVPHAEFGGSHASPGSTRLLPHALVMQSSSVLHALRPAPGTLTHVSLRQALCVSPPVHWRHPGAQVWLAPHPVGLAVASQVSPGSMRPLPHCLTGAHVLQPRQAWFLAHPFGVALWSQRSPESMRPLPQGVGAQSTWFGHAQAETEVGRQRGSASSALVQTSS
jgi:hypothetical protein